MRPRERRLARLAGALVAGMVLVGAVPFQPVAARLDPLGEGFSTLKSFGRPAYRQGRAGAVRTAAALDRAAEIGTGGTVLVEPAARTAAMVAVAASAPPAAVDAQSEMAAVAADPTGSEPPLVQAPGADMPGDNMPGDEANASADIDGRAVDAAVPATDGPATVWTLEQLVDRAIRTNPRVLGQQENMAQARAGLAAAKWEYFPTPQVQAEGNAQDHLITSTLTQPLYAFGRIGATVAAARAQSGVAESRTGEVRQDLAVRVLELYGQFASLTRQIAVLTADIQRHLDLEAMIHRRVEAGVSAPVDLNLVQTRLNQSRISRITLRARQRAVVAALSQLVGVNLGPDAIHVDEGSGTAATPGTVTADHPYLFDQPGAGDLVQRSLDRNPAIRRADAEIAVAQAEARRARTVMLPTVVARLENRTFTSGYPGNGLPTTRVTVGLSLSTGAGLASLSSITAADARTRAAVQARDALRQDVTSVVISALETFRAARKSVEGLRQNKLVQEQTAESYHRMFLAGKRSWLDVLNMVREQSGIERDLADAEVQLMVADFRLRIEAGDVA